MNVKITYGNIIHADKTIAKYEHWTFETEEEFWKQYDLIADNDTTAYIDSLTIYQKKYILIEQYREEVKING